jgi:putative glutamine amidotransferase
MQAAAYAALLVQPLIGITARRNLVISPTGSSPAYTVDQTYINAVADAGGVPLLLVPAGVAGIGRLLERLDGILLTGGGDIEPARYEGNDHATIYGVEPERDEFELALVREARDRRLPTLAICRGHQVVNVALGGSLIEDVHSMVDDSLAHFREGDAVYDRFQRVDLDPDSRLATVLGKETVWVNSIHHQGIRRPGDGMTVIGRSPDGVVEASQHEDEAWPMLAVQWHPEYLVVHDDEPSQRLFAQLIDWARAGTA